MRRFGPGLSPHTRGNQVPVLQAADMFGSIPAHTGEPPAGRRQSTGSGVYPRTHGGTTIDSYAALSDQGLSPHTRGNRRRARAESARLGSIPAHTGEPVFLLRPRHQIRVYPRTHGGTGHALLAGAAAWGLSPHTRGNPLRCSHQHVVHGSIPAHTGEPLQQASGF